MTALRRALIALLLTTVAAAAAAQTSGGAAPAPAAAPTDAPSGGAAGAGAGAAAPPVDPKKTPSEEKKDEKKPAVTKIVRKTTTGIFGNEKMPANTVTLGDAVEVTVDNDDVFRTKAGEKAVVLFINGQDTSLEPIDSATETYVFRLERTEDNKKLWERILEAPFAESTTPIHVSLGLKGGVPLPVQGDTRTLTFQKSNFRSFGAWFWIVILILALVWFFHLARRTDLLRNGPPVGGQKQAYSLGRSQMAWWLFLVLISYVTIWLITGNRDTVTNSALILIGISGATALGAVAIDATASTRIKVALDRLNMELTTLQAQLNMPGATPALINALNTRIAAIQQEQANLISTPPSVNWIMDILTDDNGAVALHRMQVILWTFVLGIVFLVSVAHMLSMPDFNPTLLALMGISGATYLGFKMPASS